MYMAQEFGNQLTPEYKNIAVTLSPKIPLDNYVDTSLTEISEKKIVKL